MAEQSIPEHPWENIGIYLFQIGSDNYLVTLDYYSNYFEIDELTTTSSEAVITKVKTHFARCSIPDIVVSDGGKQFVNQRRVAI